MEKVQFFYKSGEVEIHSEIVDFHSRPEIGETVDFEDFLDKNSSLKDSNIEPKAQFKIIKLVWKRNKQDGVYLQASLKLPTKRNYV